MEWSNLSTWMKMTTLYFGEWPDNISRIEIYDLLHIMTIVAKCNIFFRKDCRKLNPKEYPNRLGDWVIKLFELIYDCGRLEL